MIDPRARFATTARFPAAERVIVAWPQEGFAELDPIDPATAIAVLTHDPKLDDAALIAALDSDASYIGAMGSRRAQERRRERLLNAGSTRRGWTACRRRSAWTSARSARPRPRCRSWPRSSRSSTGAPAGA